MNDLPPEPLPSSGVITRDPVRLTWVLYGFVQAVVTVLLATDSISTDVAAIVTGVSLAVYVAVSELFVRPETIPRRPLTKLAAAEAAAAEGDGV